MCAFNKVGLQHLFIRTTLEDCFCTQDPEILLFFSLDPLFYNFSRSSNFSSYPNGQIKRNMAVQQNNSSNFFASNKINLLFPESLQNIFAGCKTCYTEIASQNGMISPLFTHGQSDEEIQFNKLAPPNIVSNIKQILANLLTSISPEVIRKPMV